MAIKVAVTGGTGCLGRPLVKKLLARGYAVKLLIPPQEAFAVPVEGVQIVQGTINDDAAIGELVEGVEVVFHLAAKVHGFASAPNNDFKLVNVDGTSLLMRQAGKFGVRRVVYYSTMGVYGKDGDFSGNEESPCSPATPYAISKYSAEQLVLSQLIEGVVLRFPVVYGELDRGNVAKMIEAINRHRFVIFGNGLNVRSMISADNAAEAAMLAGFAPGCAGKLYCVTDGVDYKFEQIVETICKCLATDWRPTKIPVWLATLIGALFDVFGLIAFLHLPFGRATVRKLSTSLTFSCDKIKKELGYRPTGSLVEGITEEVKWLINR